MFSKAQQKFIASLRLKKNRDKYGMFIVEGIKPINAFLDSNTPLEALYSTRSDFSVEGTKISETELSKISNLKTPQKALALFKFKAETLKPKSGLILALDAVRDPGNLGTIIRLCDWFNVEHIVCSMDTVDCYNPKVVQATMGSLARVNIIYSDMGQFLDEVDLPIYATSLKGNSVYNKNLPKEAVLIMGNEANGISSEILGYADEQLLIPKLNQDSSVESLNVAMASSIFLNEFRRPLLKGEV